jgi:hypothetical protein
MFLRESIAANSHEGKFLFRLRQNNISFWACRITGLPFTVDEGRQSNYRMANFEDDHGIARSAAE